MLVNPFFFFKKNKIMSYLLIGNISALICNDCVEPLANARIRVYLPATQDPADPLAMGKGIFNDMKPLSAKEVLMKADRLLAEGAAQFDLAARKKTYGALQKLVRDDLAILPLFQSVIAEGTKDGLQGFAPNINTSSNCWNMREWYWA